MWILEDNDIWDLEEHGNKDRLHFKMTCGTIQMEKCWSSCLDGWLLREQEDSFVPSAFFRSIFFIFDLFNLSCARQSREENLFYIPQTAKQEIFILLVCCTSLHFQFQDIWKGRVAQRCRGKVVSYLISGFIILATNMLAC